MCPFVATSAHFECTKFGIFYVITQFLRNYFFDTLSTKNKKMRHSYL